MGWIMNAKPGDKYGPCKGECKHKDCASLREEASIPCYLCNKPIGYETKFYCDTLYDDATGKLTGRTYSHFLCTWEDVEKKRRVAEAEQAAISGSLKALTAKAWNA